MPDVTEQTEWIHFGWSKKKGRRKNVKMHDDANNMSKVSFAFLDWMYCICWVGGNCEIAQTITECWIENNFNYIFLYHVLCKKHITVIIFIDKLIKTYKAEASSH